MYAIAQGEAFVGALCQSPSGCEVEKEGRRLGELQEGSAFGEMAVLGLMSSQSATIKVEKRRKRGKARQAERMCDLQYLNSYETCLIKA